MISIKELYKILVVEDNLGDFVLVEEYISEYFLNTEITNVKSFGELTTVIETTENFDIIFLDLSLPDKYGIDLVKSALALIKSTPIVVLTGYTDFNLALESLALGVSDYLLKEDLNPTTLHKCIIYNIERHKNLMRVKDSEQRYLDLFQFSPNPLIVYNKETNVILDVNDSAMEKYNYSKEEFLKLNIKDIQMFTDNINWKTENNHILEEGNLPIVYDGLKCHKKKNGELLCILTNETNFIFKDEKAVILAIEDITKEIIQIQSIQNQNKRLKDIAWMQSHVVRAPLARIMGLINLVISSSVPNEDFKEVFSMILESSEELDQIIRDIVIKAKEEN